MGLRANLYMLCMACFFYCLNTYFVGSTNTINVRLILSTYSFITVSGCVGMGPSAVLFPGVNNTKVTRRVSLMDQELLTLPEHLSSPK
jgi:hypothetical protein